MRLVEGRADIDDLDAFLADLGEVGEEFDCAVQAFDADLVVGVDHLRTAVERADRALDRGENVARDPAVEILLYAAGRRQINRALEMGVDEGEHDVVVVAHGQAEASDEAGAADAVRGLLAPVETAPASSDAGAVSTDRGPVSADRIDREAVREFFDVSEAELDATDASLADLVRERVALLDVEK
ncbi:KEOPS complex subunit Cgi121 [Halorussus salilacus]|uniref:KEOPS complex subunit Cgi121 n=1 Tax=Halorussus salilacus TaxID=2953750 RepID=UPI0020A08998|nr:KEOPS complex subunit Cgi121 [Halorussus salilacus]USZ66777.1 KEOPS complex subunit Cgi121 [Halorussus salilacus]